MKKEAMIIADAGKIGTVTIATNIAGRGVDIVLGGAPPEKANFKDPKAYKKELEKWQQEHDKVIKLGGLFVIGTERHEARRIDNQLRGRSGRQGDPGESRFYVALDDDIMRLFGGDQVSKLMDAFKLPEDIPLEHAMVSRAIEQAQVKVEGFHFDSRKHVVEYDDVMNKQREIIYKRRQKVLERADEIENVTAEAQTSTESLRKNIIENIEADIENIVAVHAPEGFSEIEYEQIIREFSEIVPFDLQSQKRIQQDLEKVGKREEITNILKQVFNKVYTDRVTALGDKLMTQIEVFVTLRTIDRLWMDHLDAIDDLREGIGLRGYGQRDPLVEYKNEAFGMFERLSANIDYEIGRQILRIQVAQQPTMPQEVITQHPQANQPATINKSSAVVGQKTIKNSKKIGRNDPCWCGSGKKWKKCHYPQLK